MTEWTLRNRKERILPLLDFFRRFPGRSTETEKISALQELFHCVNFVLVVCEGVEYVPEIMNTISLRKDKNYLARTLDLKLCPRDDRFEIKHKETVSVAAYSNQRIVGEDAALVGFFGYEAMGFIDPNEMMDKWFRRVGQEILFDQIDTMNLSSLSFEEQSYLDLDDMEKKFFREQIEKQGSSFKLVMTLKDS